MGEDSRRFCGDPGLNRPMQVTAWVRRDIGGVGLINVGVWVGHGTENQSPLDVMGMCGVDHNLGINDVGNDAVWVDQNAYGSPVVKTGVVEHGVNDGLAAEGHSVIVGLGFGRVRWHP